MNTLPEHLREFEIDLEKRQCGKPWPYSQFMLQKVSRTFALNIQILPKGVMRPVLLAYLFCRMADTIEDDAKLSGKEKEGLLEQFKLLFKEENWIPKALDLADALPESWKQSEKLDEFLTYYPEWPLFLYKDLSDGMIEATSPWILEMCDGMIKYSLMREQSEGWLRLRSEQDLNDYCYYVAGTVGYMLTEQFAVYSSLVTPERKEEMLKLCNSFGLGLQITNIIKDIHEDFQRQTCYVPAEYLSEFKLSHAEFLNPQNVDQAYKVVRKMVKKAMGHLEDAFEYTLLLPRLEPRLRLFCLWPLFLATATLAKVLEKGTVLSPEKVKLTRPEVKKILRRTTVNCIFNGRLRTLFAEESAHIRSFIGDDA